MPKVLLKNNQIRIGSRRVSLLSGEVHYWRLHPSNWEPVLDKVRGLGLEMVSTYIPWQYHEASRGRLDFTGRTDPPRNLKKFLELARRKKLSVIIRPGPYIYSEWPNLGVPDYAHRYHRLDPRFLRYAERYMRSVVSFLKPYFASHGGPVVMLQADNEIDPMPDLYGRELGLQGGKGLFQDYLRRVYRGDIQKLNTAWGTELPGFDQAGAHIACMLTDGRRLALKGDRELVRNRDYIGFKYDYSRRVAGWNVETYKKLGVDIPVFLNVYPFFYVHDWKEFQEVSDLVGIDFYPCSEFAEDEHEHRKFMDKIRHFKTASKSAFIAEFECGVWHGQHTKIGALPPNHYRLMCISALAAGCTGWNWYMLVNRDNWYMSPINEWGREREDLYPVFRSLVSVFRSLRPESLEKVTPLAVTFYPMHYGIRTYPQDGSAAHALYKAGLDYETWDPRSGICRKPVLFYSGSQWLDRRAQENLRDYVRSGGTLVAFQHYPRKDENFRPLHLAGFEDPRSILFEFKRKLRFRLGPGAAEIEAVSTAFDFNEAAGEPVTVRDPRLGKLTVGYWKRMGKGRILHLGLEAAPELVRAVAEFLKALPPSGSTHSQVTTALFRRGSRHYLFAMNNGDASQTAAVTLAPIRNQRIRSARDLFKEKAIPVTSGPGPRLVLDIPRKDATIVELI